MDHEKKASILVMESSEAEKSLIERRTKDAEQGAEWIKSAAVSEDQARRSLDRLDTLERNKPTLGQVGRYGGIGGLGGAAIGAVGNAIETGSALKGATPREKALNLAASTVKGALGGGALPLLRAHSDRHAEMGTLRKFMVQDKVAAIGAAPLWRRQAGFTPPGMQTAAQRLQKSMAMGKVDPNKGLKPLNIKVGGVLVELAKQAGLIQRLPQAIRSLPGAAKNVALGANEAALHKNEIAGLGVLAVPGLDTLQASARARPAGDKSHGAVEKRQLMGEGMHAALDVGGLGLLAAPAVAHLKHAFANSGYAGNVAQNGPGMKSHSQLPPFKQAPIQVKVSSPLKRVGELVTGSKASRLREAAGRHTGKGAHRLRRLARVEEDRVGKVQGALVGSAALGAVSDTTGLAEKVRGSKKEAGVGVGAGMTTSQYSGPLSYGPFKMTSGIPAFRRPAMTKGDPALEGEAWMYGENKEASMAATGAMTPAGKLQSAQRVGAPKVTGFAGPSIADISKPKGYGTPLPGAQKNQL